MTEDDIPDILKGMIGNLGRAEFRQNIALNMNIILRILELSLKYKVKESDLLERFFVLSKLLQGKYQKKSGVEKNLNEK